MVDSFEDKNWFMQAGLEHVNFDGWYFFKKFEINKVTTHIPPNFMQTVMYFNFDQNSWLRLRKVLYPVLFGELYTNASLIF